MISSQSHLSRETRNRLFPLLAVLLIAVGWSGIAAADLRQEPMNFGRFAEIAETIKPAVVNIQTRSKVSMPDGMDFFSWHPFFEDMPRDRETTGQGSGVIISGDGYIITNNHVVENATEINVKFLGSARTYPAELIGSDPKTDLALIRVEDTSHIETTAKIGDSDELRVGDWVMAIGHPFGLEHTVSVGVVSAKERFLDGSYDNYIQTDAVINPGNSGGPLLNIYGEIVGINTAIYTRTGGSMGIGFAIPANLTKNIIDQLRDKGTVERGYLGVSISMLDEQMADTLGIEEPAGALVREVMVGTPAYKAGIEVGDVIVQFNDRKVREPRDLSLAVAQSGVGVDSEVTLIRDGKRMRLDVETARLEEEEPMARGRRDQDRDEATPRLGMSYETYDPRDTRRGFGRERRNIEGVIVTSVAPRSPAQRAGILEGDIIVKVNRDNISRSEELTKAISSAESGDSLLLTVVRESRQVLIMIPIE